MRPSKSIVLPCRLNVIFRCSNKRVAHFGWLVVERQLTDYYDEVSQVLKEFREEGGLEFPTIEYRYAAIQAILADNRGEKVDARQFARKALAEAAKDRSGLRYHPTVGLVGSERNTFASRIEDARRQLTHIMAHLSRARTLIVPLFLKFFSGAIRRLDESRSDDASRAPRGSVVAVVAGAASGTKHIWGLYRLPLPGRAGCGHPAA